MKCAIFWIGVKNTNKEVLKRFRYGDFSWMEYSKRTWLHYCKRHDIDFIHYNVPRHDDTMKYKITWQRWLDFHDYVGSYDRVLMVDASSMVKWDAPNFFEKYPADKWGAMQVFDNLKWVLQSVEGYKDMFPDVDFNLYNYTSGAFNLIPSNLFWVIEKLQEFYYQNHEKILEHEDKTVKRGTDQPVLNYILQKYDVPKVYFDRSDVMQHLYRYELLAYNWQLQGIRGEIDKTPFFIKYVNVWIFTGFGDRGATREKLMSYTWNLIADKYE